MFTILFQQELVAEHPKFRVKYSVIQIDLLNIVLSFKTLEYVPLHCLSSVKATLCMI